jgi:hypothetical protein
LDDGIPSHVVASLSFGWAWSLGFVQESLPEKSTLDDGLAFFYYLSVEKVGCRYGVVRCALIEPAQVEEKRF